ncbi:MAG: two-component regulator propeller domain-containing protein [Bacteroidota bacterium]
MKQLQNILFFVLAVMLPAFGFSQEYKFKHIGKQQGLSQSRVNCILQDKNGFIWFGTDDGLNKYNGQRIEVYKNDSKNEKTISDNWINCLYEDDNGTLWIGTLEGGLNEYNRFTNEFRSYQFENKNENSISNNNVYTIIRNDEKTLWIGTDDGLNLFDIETKKFTRFKDEMVLAGNPKFTIMNDQVRTLYLDVNDMLWIGTFKSGLLSYNKKSKEFEQYPDLDENGEYAVQNANRIRTIYEDRSGTLWIGHDGGYLSKFDRTGKKFSYYFHDENDPRSLSNRRVTSILEDHRGVLWIGTGDGVSIYDPKNDNFRVIRSIENNPFSLGDNYVRVIYEDKARSLWFGTDSYGVAVYHRSSGKFNHISKDSYDVEGLKSNTIFCFEEDNRGKIWVGTIGAGLSVYNPQRNRFENFYPRDINLTHDNILCINEVNGKIWFGTWGGGVNYFDLSESRFGQPLKAEEGEVNISNNNVLDIDADAKGNLWLSTLGGLNYVDFEKDTVMVFTTENGLPHNQIYTSYLSPAGKLWIGTNGGGLSVMDVKSGEIKNYIKGGKNSITNNTIHCIADDGKGNLWFGTKNGLSKFDVAADKFTNYNESDGLSSNFIVGILFDKQGNLWLSSNNGLTKFNPEEGKQVQKVRMYYAIDGLQGDEFNQNAFLQTKRGEMFFGGVNGFNHFFPENIVDNPYIPPVVITSFKVLGKDYELDSAITHKKNIELNYRQNFLSFEFASLDYVLPEKNLYSYKMEGVDEDWSVPSTRSFANYTDLQGGEYIFRVKATNNDGVWNNEGVAIKIVIIPPFWKTKWFYTLCIFLTIAIVFLFIRLRIASIKKEKKRLEEMVAQRTRELAEKNRDIMSSIEYAKRIQEAILPDRNYIFNHLPDSFILFRPKDIVSGDFYWFGVVENKKIIAAVDCTGHGVPGAFMSMIGHNILNQVILEKKITQPAEILRLLRLAVKAALKQEGKEKDANDGMDLSICVIDTKTNEVEFAGAFRPLVIIKNGSLEKIEGDKSPIGGGHFTGDFEYTTHKRKITKGDTLYMYSDGFVDQFGGPQGKKFMGKKLHQLLLEIQHMSMTEQNFFLIDIFEKWAGNLEQVDDVLVIGVKC